MRHSASRTRAARVGSIVLSLAVALATVAEAPSVFAQDAPTGAPKKPRKPKKPKATEPAPEAPPTETPAPAPPPVEPAPVTPPPAETAPAPAEAKGPEGDLAPITDVTEKPAKTYYFVGLRYRGTVIPKFLLNAFVEEGTTIYSNTIGAEIDIRRDDFSMIPWLVYSSYGTGDMLFRSKGDDPTLAQNYSVVQSDLHAIYVGADVLWSKKIANNFDFEYGAGFGIGFLFGTLHNDWAYDNPSAALVGANGNHYAACGSATDAPSCSPLLHKGAATDPAKANNYAEKNWFNGGSVPTIFPHLALPELGIRYKPIKEMEARASIGFSLTGFFFGLSVDYGLESRQPDGAPATPAPSSSPSSGSSAR